MVRKTASRLRETPFLLAETAFAEHIGAALRDELGATRRATKTVMRWANVSDTTARGWINGRCAPSGRHLLVLAANSDVVLRKVLALTDHADLDLALSLQDIQRRLELALTQVCAATSS
ncbi:MAG TPA: hypothetical protein VFP14_03270 [Novosphingobium sp.]|nr:hypothetical protein [Novosphingobium sp.]